MGIVIRAAGRRIRGGREGVGMLLGLCALGETLDQLAGLLWEQRRTRPLLDTVLSYAANLATSYQALAY